MYKHLMATRLLQILFQFIFLMPLMQQCCGMHQLSTLHGQNTGLQIKQSKKERNKETLTTTTTINKLY